MMTPIRPVRMEALAAAPARTAAVNRQPAAQRSALPQPQFGLTTLSFGNGVPTPQKVALKTPPMANHQPVGQKLDYYA